MISAIVGLLSSLPELLSLAKSVWAWIQEVSGGDVKGFILKSNEAFDLLRHAKSDQEKANAAKAIQDLLRRT